MSRFPKQKLFNRTLTIAAKQKVYEKLIFIFYSCISKFTTVIGLLNFSIWTNGQYWFFGSVPVSVLKFHSTGSSTSVLVPSSWYQGFLTRFSGVIWTFLTLILVWFHFGTIAVQNQVGPIALVLEPKMSRTYTAQNFWYQNKKVTVCSVFSVIAQL